MTSFCYLSPPMIQGHSNEHQFIRSQLPHTKLEGPRLHHTNTFGKLNEADEAFPDKGKSGMKDLENEFLIYTGDLLDTQRYFKSCLEYCIAALQKCEARSQGNSPRSTPPSSPRNRSETPELIASVSHLNSGHNHEIHGRASLTSPRPLNESQGAEHGSLEDDAKVKIATTETTPIDFTLCEENCAKFKDDEVPLRTYPGGPGRKGSVRVLRASPKKIPSGGRKSNEDDLAETKAKSQLKNGLPQGGQWWWKCKCTEGVFSAYGKCGKLNHWTVDKCQEKGCMHRGPWNSRPGECTRCEKWVVDA